MSETSHTPPDSGARAIPRPRQWDRLVATQRGLLREHMAWPIASMLSLGVVASFMISPGYQGAWIVLVALTVAGGLLNFQKAVLLGVLCFISYGAWLFWPQLQHGVSGGEFIILASMPFAPLWLAAMRTRQNELMHLAVLLTLPQVRAAMDLSTWSLLPSARALDMRLQAHTAADTIAPALLIRLRLDNLDNATDLLGQRVVRGEVMRLANILRENLRIGDLITEDLKNHDSLFILAFPNPSNPDIQAILRRLQPALKSTDLAMNVHYARVPDDGVSLSAMVWHNDSVEV